MPYVRFNPARHAYGTGWESKLHHVLEQIIGEPLTKTKQQTDLMDFSSPSFLVELKSRSKKYQPADFTTWLLPVCKADEAKAHPEKQTLFFYYFESVDELYMLEYNTELFQTFRREIPPWHLEKQEHYYTPAEQWTFVNLVELKN